MGERREPSIRRNNEYRTPWLIDSAKILHSFAFRRLQGKRQVLGIDQGDFHRTRLTHSSEVASIARSIFEYLFDEEKKRPVSKEFYIQDTHKETDQAFGTLVEFIKIYRTGFIDALRAISMAHDIGHPPFGHAGEQTLNYLMRCSGGFEGNAQNIQLVHKIEKFNLTRLVLMGLIKYPAKIKIIFATKANYHPNLFNLHIGLEDFKSQCESQDSVMKGYYADDEALLKWIFEYPDGNSEFTEFVAQYTNGLNELKKIKKKKVKAKNEAAEFERTSIKSFPCSIMDIADDISNAVHDLEDGINLNLLSKERLSELLSSEEKHVEELFGNKISSTKKLIDGLFNEKNHERKSHVGDIIHVLTTNTSITTNPGKFSNPFLQFRVVLKKNAYDFVIALKKIVMDEIIKSQSVQVIEYGGARAIVDIFNAFEKNSSLLPEKERKKLELPENKNNKNRIICDYIAGMTDNYLLNLYSKLSGSSAGSVFERL